MTKLDTQRLRAILAAVDRPEGVTYGDEARFEEAFNHETIAALLDAADKADAACQTALAAIKAVPRRAGTPEWSKAADAGQAVGFDVGLARASDAVCGAFERADA